MNKLKVIVEDKSVFEEQRHDNIHYINTIKQLENENLLLKADLASKQTIIELLITNSNYNENKQATLEQNNEWIKSKTQNKNTFRVNDKLLLSNRFGSLSFKNNCTIAEPDEPNEREDELENTVTIHQKSTKQKKRHDIIIDKHPERYTTPTRTVPENSSYANIVSKGKKIMLFCDSHGKRIRRNEFNKYLTNGYAHIKSFPGATAKHLNHYVEPALQENSPDVVVIMVGSNNITSRGRLQQNEIEIAEDIIKVGKTCSESGVNEIYISSVTCQYNHISTKKVSAVNELLKEMCVREHFVYISHDSIKQNHLYKDGIHLLDEGTNILANNIINSINTSF